MNKFPTQQQNGQEMYQASDGKWYPTSSLPQGWNQGQQGGYGNQGGYGQPSYGQQQPMGYGGQQHQVYVQQRPQGMGGAGGGGAAIGAGLLAGCCLGGICC